MGAYMGSHFECTSLFSFLMAKLNITTLFIITEQITWHFQVRPGVWQQSETQASALSFKTYRL
uniref:Uncharacterized protein n=1 Tax=Anguilla anguilla TaxID=7936 RepID=A0A0E9RIZ4_ANGAN